MARLTFADAMGTTLRAVSRNLPAYFRTQGVVLLGAALLLTFFAATLWLGGTLLAGEGRTTLGVLATTAYLVGVLLVLLVYVASLGIGVHVADAALRGKRIRLAEAWALARPRLGNLGGTLLALGLFLIAVVGFHVAGAFLLAGAGATLIDLLFLTLLADAVGLHLLVRWMPALPLSMLEGHAPRANLRLASHLTAGSRWALVGALLAAALLLQAALFGGMLLVGVLLGPLAQLLRMAGVALLVGTLTLLVSAFLAVANFFLVTLAVVAYRRLRPEPPPVLFEVVPDDEPALTL